MLIRATRLAASIMTRRRGEISYEANVGEPSAETMSGYLHFVKAADVQEEPVEWVWERRLPTGVLALAAGAGGSAKSIWSCWLASSVSRGTMRGDWKGIQQGVIWATIE